MAAMQVTAAERRVCACLRGERDGAVDADVLAAARRHRVHLLVSAIEPPLAFADPDAARALKREERAAAVFDARRQDDMRRLLDAFGDAHIDVLAFKGAALAHTLYAAPHLRPRTDVDLLIRRTDLERAEQLLAAAGWQHPPEPDGEVFAAQRHYAKPRGGGADRLLDLHWRIANPHVFGDAMSFDELSSRAVALPALGRTVCAPHPVDALWLACIHRVAHHDDEIDLLWLWDIHLLVSQLSDDDRSAFTALARRTAMTSVCHRGIATAADLFATPRSAPLMAVLAADASEPSARFLGGMPRASVFVSDLKALPSWRARARLTAEHLFPPMEYMRARYPAWPSLLVPFAYVDRLLRGAPRWLRHDTSTD
jgi:hypothetical protein